jgi:hypothetical protein
MSEVLSIVREAWAAEFRKQKGYIDGALAQLSDEQFRARPAANINSAAIIVNFHAPSPATLRAISITCPA